jgi:hypothetical protein
MKKTDDVSAEIFYADMLLPLRQAMTRRGQAFFTSGPDADKPSYWEPEVTRTSGIQELPAEHDGAAMLRLLGTYWGAQGEGHLSRLLPGLEALRQSLTSVSETRKEEATEITEFVYPLH